MQPRPRPGRKKRLTRMLDDKPQLNSSLMEPSSPSGASPRADAQQSLWAVPAVGAAVAVAAGPWASSARSPARPASTDSDVQSQQQSGAASAPASGAGVASPSLPRRCHGVSFAPGTKADAAAAAAEAVAPVYRSIDRSSAGVSAAGPSQPALRSPVPVVGVSAALFDVPADDTPLSRGRRPRPAARRVVRQRDDNDDGGRAAADTAARAVDPSPPPRASPSAVEEVPHVVRVRAPLSWLPRSGDDADEENDDAVRVSPAVASGVSVGAPQPLRAPADRGANGPVSPRVHAWLPRAPVASGVDGDAAAATTLGRVTRRGTASTAMVHTADTAATLNSRQANFAGGDESDSETDAAAGRSAPTEEQLLAALHAASDVCVRGANRQRARQRRVYVPPLQLAAPASIVAGDSAASAAASTRTPRRRAAPAGRVGGPVDGDDGADTGAGVGLGTALSPSTDSQGLTSGVVESKVRVQASWLEAQHSSRAWHSDASGARVFRVPWCSCFICDSVR